MCVFVCVCVCFILKCFNYSRHIVLGGERGHIAMLDRIESHLQCELFVDEAVRDVHFLHNHTMFAVAQRRYTYIYDRQGLELHRLKHHIDVHALDFLPFHYLLVSGIFFYILF